jgi:2-aminoadipate transaminase
MPEDTDSGAIDHLLTDTIQSVIDRSAYGDWRSIANADAVALSFGFPDPDLFAKEDFLASTEQIVVDAGDDELQYGGGEYSDELESFLRDQETERGIDFETNDLLVTNGATHAIDSTCRAFLQPGDTILVEQPTFMGALGVFWNFGVNIVGVPVDENGMDVDALAEILQSRTEAGLDSPKLLYTIPDFHNPTGTTLSRERRERVLDIAEAHDFAILEDGAYSDLHFDTEAPPPLATLDDDGRVVRVGTFSKTIAPGIRTGWLTAPSRVREAIRSVAAGGTNTFTRAAVGHYCSSGQLDTAIPELQTTYADRCAHMLDALETEMPADVTWTEPDGGFFVWVEVPDTVDTSEMLSDAAEAGVTYLPGSMFYPDEGGESSLRLSFTFVKPPAITEGIQTLADCIRRHRV